MTNRVVISPSLPTHAFTYEGLRQSLQGPDDQLMRTDQNAYLRAIPIIRSGNIRFFQLEGTSSLPWQKLNAGRAKIHAHIHPDDVEKAWNAMLPILEKYPVISKVRSPGSNDIGDKTITIYEGRDLYSDVPRNEDGGIFLMDTPIQIRAERMQYLLNELETALEMASIRSHKDAYMGNPGDEIFPNVDCDIRGSQYFSYRMDIHDRGVEGGHISAAIARLVADRDGTSPHNPYNYPDPVDGRLLHIESLHTEACSLLTPTQLRT